jgi:ATP-binding protein involved in chromosome partitioning
MRIFSEIEPQTSADGPLPAPDISRLRANLAGIKAVIAVGSAKGGTGKSAVTVNVAAALALAGRKVGILDADLNSPSILPMLGMTAPRRIFAFEGAAPGAGPLGLRVAASNLLPDGEPPPMSFLDEEPAAETLVNGGFRPNGELPARVEVASNGHGPVELSFSGTLRRLLTETRFGALDVLLVDLAPGLDQLYRIARIAPLSGAIIVTNPSEISVNAAKRALEIAARCATRVIGVIENMVGFSCDGCHTVRPLMPQGDLSAVAQQAGIAVIGRLPFDPRLAETSDRGVLFVRDYAATPLALNLTAIAETVDRALSAISHAPLATPA